MVGGRSGRKEWQARSGTKQLPAELLNDFHGRNPMSIIELYEPGISGKVGWVYGASNTLSGSRGVRMYISGERI